MVPTFGFLAKLADYGRTAVMFGQPFRGIPLMTTGDLLLPEANVDSEIPLQSDRLYRYDLLFLLRTLKLDTYWLRERSSSLNLCSKLELPAQQWLTYMLTQLEDRPMQNALDFRNFCFGEMFQPSLLASFGIPNAFQPNLEEVIVSQMFTL